jgi:hypothetical protein
LAANNGYPITTRNSGFARKRGYSNNVSWHPAPALANWRSCRPRQQRPRYFCACSQPAESYIGLLGIHRQVKRKGSLLEADAADADLIILLWSQRHSPLAENEFFRNGLEIVM